MKCPLFVFAKSRQETGNGAGHAETRVSLDVVAADTRAHPFGCGVAVLDGPLAGTVDGNGVFTVFFNKLLEPFRHKVESLLHGGFLEPAIAPDERFRQAVFAVKDGGQMVALHAEAVRD